MFPQGVSRPAGADRGGDRWIHVEYCLQRAVYVVPEYEVATETCGAFSCRPGLFTFVRQSREDAKRRALVCGRAKKEVGAQSSCIKNACGCSCARGDVCAAEHHVARKACVSAISYALYGESIMMLLGSLAGRGISFFLCASVVPPSMRLLCPRFPCNTVNTNLPSPIRTTISSWPQIHSIARTVRRNWCSPSSSTSRHYTRSAAAWWRTARA